MLLDAGFSSVKEVWRKKIAVILIAEKSKNLTTATASILTNT